MSRRKSTSVREINLRLKCILCSYCGEKMEGGVAEVERPVPQGARDLGITDEIYCWICQKCGLKSTEDLRFCTCGALTLNCHEKLSSNFHDTNTLGVYGYLDNFEVTYINEEHEVYYCCYHCIKCELCSGEMNDENFIQVCNNETEGVFDKDKFTYLHIECHRKREIENQEKIKQERIKNSLCVTCRNSIGLMDKLAGRDKHKSC